MHTPTNRYSTTSLSHRAAHTILVLTANDPSPEGVQ